MNECIVAQFFLTHCVVSVDRMQTMHHSRNGVHLMQYSYSLLNNSYGKQRSFDVVAKCMASRRHRNNAIFRATEHRSSKIEYAYHIIIRVFYFLKNAYMF